MSTKPKLVLKKHLQQNQYNSIIKESKNTSENRRTNTNQEVEKDSNLSLVGVNMLLVLYITILQNNTNYFSNFVNS